MLKKHMFAAKGAQKIANRGKGSQSAALPDRSQINSLARPASSSMNDYAKATPMAQGVQPAIPEGGPPGGPWPLT